MRVLAAATQRRVAAVEMPGITMNVADPRATTRQRPDPALLRALRSGDYQPAADWQWHALTDAWGETPARIRLVGESLGAQLAVALTDVIERSPSTVASVDLVEAANPGALSILRLLQHGLALARTEEARRQDYIALNTARGWPPVTSFEQTSPEYAAVDRLLKRWRVQGAAAFASAWGLRRGLVRTFTAPAPSSTPPLTLWRMDDSALSSPADSTTLLETARGSGWPAAGFTVTAPAFPEPLGHHALTSFDLLAAFGDTLRRRWDGHEAEAMGINEEQ